MKKRILIFLIVLTFFNCTKKTVRPIDNEIIKKKLNWKYSFDFDNDKIRDSITTSFSNGANCCYYLKIKLSSEKKWKIIKTEINGGYLLGLDLSNKQNFNISDFDKDKLPEIKIKNIENSKITIIDFIKPKKESVYNTKIIYLDKN